jgi:hypothetical protein
MDGGRMDDSVKKEVLEIIEIAKTCPEGLQVRVAEILLAELFQQQRSFERSSNGNRTNQDEAAPAVSPKPQTAQVSNSEAQSFRFPLRLRAFLKKYNVAPEKIENFFHIEDGQVVPMWSVNATKIAEGQIQVALFVALGNAISSGEFSFEMKDVHAACKEHKIEESNWTNNFKNNSKLFGNLEKDGPISLSEEGMKRLASLLVPASAE